MTTRRYDKEGAPRVGAPACPGGEEAHVGHLNVPMQRWCEREDDAADGHLTTASGALWWTCDSCDLEVDVTDEVQAFFRGESS